MSRLVAIIWLSMAWLIAVLAGFTLRYSFEAGLGTLGVLSALMAVGVLLGSIAPLTGSFELWDRPERQPSTSPPRAAVLTSEVPSLRTLVHEAGTPAGEVQRCARCAVVLIDPARDRTVDGGPARSVPAGTWIEERGDVFYPAASPRALKAGESLCTPRSERPFAWQSAGGD